jgi:peptide/nickel transport system permease protein
MSIADPSVASDLAPDAGGERAETPPAPGLSPGALALRRLRRNRIALGFGALFFVLVALALAAPLRADVAGTTPARNHLSDKVVVDGQARDVMTLAGVPVGPTWQKRFFLGADSNGRDVAVRLLYGARNSLFIGVVAALITTVVAVLLGMLAGYFRGWVDGVISRGLDVLWAFPVLLLGVALGVSLALGGLKIGPLEIQGNSKWIPTIIIGVVGVVYLARPVRGQVLSLREKEFVEAARSLGASDRRIIAREILPNLVAPLIVYASLLIPANILLEAALSFLGVGVAGGTPSWGAMISEATSLFPDAWWFMLFPGLALLVTVLAFNLVGDGLQDALDPRRR